MSWEKSSYTTAGATLLSESLSGGALIITRAVSGTGTVDTDLSNEVAVSGEIHELSLLAIETVNDGEKSARKVSIYVGGDDTSYIMHQIGVFGRLNEGAETLLFLMQDERGIEIPAKSISPDYEFQIAVLLAISTKANISITVDPQIQAFKKLLEKHDTDPAAHEETIRKAVQAAASGAVQIKDITIPAEGWTQSPGSDEAAALSYTIDLAVEGVTEAVYPSVAVHKAALEAANTAGLCPAVQALAGVLRFWAQTPPKTNLSATAILMTPGNMVGSSAGYVLPVATATRLGGVKIGPGITASPDGTITASNSGIPPEKVVSATDTEKMLDEIFPDNA